MKEAHDRMAEYFKANAPEPKYLPPTYVYKPIRQRRYEGPVKPRT